MKDKAKMYDIHTYVKGGYPGNMRDCIDAYGAEYFWGDYKEYLGEHYNTSLVYHYLSQATYTYFRLKNN